MVLGFCPISSKIMLIQLSVKVSIMVSEYMVFIWGKVSNLNAHAKTMPRIMMQYLLTAKVLISLDSRTRFQNNN